MVRGAPVATPSSTPLTRQGLSSSTRGVVPSPPDLRRAISFIISSSEIFKPGSTPSMVHPIIGPWDSPKMETLKILPKLFIAVQTFG